MATSKTIIAISLKAHVPIGGDIEGQAKILNVVAKAHESGDYSEVLKIATIDTVKAEMKRRRFEDEPAAAPAETTQPEPDPKNAEAPSPAAEARLRSVAPRAASASTIAACSAGPNSTTSSAPCAANALMPRNSRSGR